MATVDVELMPVVGDYFRSTMERVPIGTRAELSWKVTRAAGPPCYMVAVVDAEPRLPAL